MLDLKAYRAKKTEYISPNSLAGVLGVSLATIKSREARGIYKPVLDQDGNIVYALRDLYDHIEIKSMTDGSWAEEIKIQALYDYRSVELFAGAGGLALGLEKAGFSPILLNEIDRDACLTLQVNRPNWDVKCCDIQDLDLSHLRGQVHLLAGGFPCQAFSYAGKQGGFNDTRGTLFFQLARAAQEIQPEVILAENVRGLSAHDKGRTLDTIKATIAELGYTLITPRILKAVMYQVPQKRERIFLIAVRNDLADQAQFSWPAPYERVMTLRDAFYAGMLFDTDVVPGAGQLYPEKKREVLAQVPMGGFLERLARGRAEDLYGRELFFRRRENRYGTSTIIGRTKPYINLLSSPKANGAMPSN